MKTNRLAIAFARISLLAMATLSAGAMAADESSAAANASKDDAVFLWRTPSNAAHSSLLELLPNCSWVCSDGRTGSAEVTSEAQCAATCAAACGGPCGPAVALPPEN